MYNLTEGVIAFPVQIKSSFHFVQGVVAAGCV